VQCLHVGIVFLFISCDVLQLVARVDPFMTEFLDPYIRCRVETDFALCFITKAEDAGGNMHKMLGSCICRYPCLQCMLGQRSVLAESLHWQF